MIMKLSSSLVKICRKAQWTLWDRGKRSRSGGWRAGNAVGHQDEGEEPPTAWQDSPKLNWNDCKIQGHEDSLIIQLKRFSKTKLNWNYWKILGHQDSRINHLTSYNMMATIIELLLYLFVFQNKCVECDMRGLGVMSGISQLKFFIIIYMTSLS